MGEPTFCFGSEVGRDTTAHSPAGQGAAHGVPWGTRALRAAQQLWDPRTARTLLLPWE